MNFSFQTKNNFNYISDIEKTHGLVFENAEIFKECTDGHKFIPGQELVLFGLEDYPEFNGEKIIITSIRKDGNRGKTYYFQSENLEIAKQLNWVYEYRLRKI